MADGNDIDRLQIEVESSSASAEQGIRSLIGALSDLREKCNGGCGLKSFAKQLGETAQAAKGLDNATAAKLSAMATALSKLSQLGKISLPANLGDKIRDLGGAVSSLRGGLEGVTQERLQSLANALAALREVNDVKISSTIGSQIGAIGAAVSMLPDGMDAKLQGFAQAVMALQGLRDIRISSTLANNILDIGIAAEQIAGVDFTNLTTLATALQGFQGLTISTSVNNQLERLVETVSRLNAVDFSGLQNLSQSMAPLMTMLQSMNGTMSATLQRLSNLATQARRLQQVNMSAAQSTLNLYAGFRMAATAVRGIATQIASFITKANDYIEDVNLFTASMGEYAQTAKDYAEYVGSLMGIDPGKWMRNQGIFQTLATGFGVSADRAYIMSKNLTQLGYDLASFFNIAVEGEGGAMQKLQAGLSGELEPLRRLGYDLSEARLKAIALSLGIDKAFNSMTQAEKSQLRYYAIMTQVTTAQGDMARTLDTPANQLRVLKAAAEQAGRAFGNTLIPALNAILPVAIAVANALRIVASAIASLFGFVMPSVDYSGINNAASAAGDLDNNLKGAGGSAKKLNELLADWDELNIIQSKSGGGGGGGGGSLGDMWNFDLPEYDFLSNLVKTRADEILARWKPVLNWMTENMDSLLAVAGGIGASILEWSLAKKFIPSIKKSSVLIDNLFKGVAALAIEAATIALNVHFTTEFLEKGNWGSLLGGAITDIFGSTLFGKIIESMIFKNTAWSKTAGTVATGVSFLINGSVSMGLALNDIKAEGFNGKNMLVLLKGSLENAAGLYMIAEKIVSAIFGPTTGAEKVGIGAAALGVAMNVALNLALTEGGLTEGDPIKIIESLGTNALTAAGVGTAISVSFKNAQAGFIATGIVLAADATMDMYLGMGDIVENGVTEANILTVAKGGLEALLGTGLIASFGLKGKFDPATAAKGVGAGLLLAVGLGLSMYLSNEAKLADENGDILAWLGEKAGGLVSAAVTGFVASKVLGMGASGAWELTGGMIALTSVLNLSMSLGDAMQNGWTETTLKQTIADGIGFGVGAAAIAIGVGATVPVAAAVGAAALVVAAAAALTFYILSPKASKLDDFSFGAVEATADEIEQYVKDNLFTRNLDYNITIMKTEITNTAQVKASLNTKVAQINTALRSLIIKTKVDAEDPQITTLKNQVDGVLSQLQTYLDTSENMLSISAGIVPLKDENGNDISGQFLTNIQNADSEIMQGAQKLGDMISEELTKAFTNGLDGRESEWVQSLMGMLSDLSLAVTQGEASAKFATGVQGLLNFKRSTFQDTLTEYIKQRNTLKQELSDAYDAMYTESKGREAGLKKLMENEEKLNGQSEEYFRLRAQWEAMALQNANMLANKDKSVGDAFVQYSAEGERMFREAMKTLFTFSADKLDFSSGAVEEAGYGVRAFFTDAMKNGLENVDYGYLEDQLSYALGTLVLKNNDELFRLLEPAVKEGIISWADLFGDESKDAIFKNLFNGDSKFAEVFDTLWEQIKKKDEIDLEIDTPDYSEPKAAIEGFGNSVTSMASTVNAGVQNTLNALASLKNASVSLSTSVTITTQNAGGTAMPRMGFPIRMAAAGGEFENGEFFVARENGPELVGRIGRKTAVANNEHIETGIESGVRAANRNVETGLDRLHDDMRVLIQKTGHVELRPSTALAQTVKRSQEMRLRSEGV